MERWRESAGRRAIKPADRGRHFQPPDCGTALRGVGLADAGVWDYSFRMRRQPTTIRGHDQNPHLRVGEDMSMCSGFTPRDDGNACLSSERET